MLQVLVPAGCAVAAMLARAWPVVNPALGMGRDHFVSGSRIVVNAAATVAPRIQARLVELTAEAVKSAPHVHSAFLRLEQAGKLSWKQVGSTYCLRFVPNAQGMQANLNAASLEVKDFTLRVDQVAHFLNRVGIHLGHPPTDNLWAKLQSLAPSITKQAERLRSGMGLKI